MAAERAPLQPARPSRFPLSQPRAPLPGARPPPSSLDELDDALTKSVAPKATPRVSVETNALKVAMAKGSTTAPPAQCPSPTSSSELIARTSARNAARLDQLERLLRTQEVELRKSEEENRRLQDENRRVKRENREIHKFLSDYGMQWVGGGASGPGSARPTPGTTSPLPPPDAAEQAPQTEAPRAPSPLGDAAPAAHAGSGAASARGQASGASPSAPPAASTSSAQPSSARPGERLRAVREPAPRAVRADSRPRELTADFGAEGVGRRVWARRLLAVRVRKLAALPEGAGSSFRPDPADVLRQRVGQHAARRMPLGQSPCWRRGPSPVHVRRLAQRGEVERAAGPALRLHAGDDGPVRRGHHALAVGGRGAPGGAQGQQSLAGSRTPAFRPRTSLGSLHHERNTYVSPWIKYILQSPVISSKAIIRIKSGKSIGSVKIVPHRAWRAHGLPGASVCLLPAS